MPESSVFSLAKILFLVSLLFVAMNVLSLNFYTSLIAPFKVICITWQHAIYTYVVILDEIYLLVYFCRYVCMRTTVIYYFIVDGGWSSWKPGPCSKTCGGGIQNYTRVCKNPKPSCEGKNCKGPRVYTAKKKCNNFCCPGT